MRSNIFHAFLIILIQFSFVQLFGQKTSVRPDSWASKVEACNLHNLYKLNDSIYRSDQPDKAMFACLVKTGIRGVLNLRSHHLDSGLVEGSPIRLYTVEMVANKFTDQEIIESLRILKSGTKPILVHCLHGSDLSRALGAHHRQNRGRGERRGAGYGRHIRLR